MPKREKNVDGIWRSKLGLCALKIVGEMPMILER